MTDMHDRTSAHEHIGPDRPLDIVVAHRGPLDLSTIRSVRAGADRGDVDAADREQAIRAALRVLMRPGCVYELRVPKAGRQRTISGYYNDPKKLLEAACKLEDQCVPAIYVTLNPCNPALLARRCNRYEAYAEQTTSDADIACRHWLLIDCDPIRPSGISSSDHEHERAITTAMAIWDDLRSMGFPDPVVCDSGNGVHLLFPIDAPNDAEATGLISAALASIAAHSAPEDIAVDVTVFNAARITKLYGTMARKGDSTPDRPHRRSRILEVPANLEPIPWDKCRRLLAKLAEWRPVQVIAAPGPTQTGFDVVRWLRRHRIAVRRGPIPWGDKGERWELVACPFDPSHTNGSAVVTRGSNGSLGFRCQHNSCAGRGWRDFRRFVEGK